MHGFNPKSDMSFAQSQINATESIEQQKTGKETLCMFVTTYNYIYISYFTCIFSIYFTCGSDGASVCYTNK